MSVIVPAIASPISRIVTTICAACHRAFNATVLYNKGTVEIRCPFCGRLQ